jgi:octaprenyl-diphosphate synthase
LILALSRCNREERKIVEEAVDADPLTKEQFLRVVQIIDRHQGIRYTIEKAMAYVESAKRRLDIFPDSPEKAALVALADFVVQRRL